MNLEPLVRALEAHAAVDSKEAADREALLRLVRRGGDPFARTGFEPGHVTGSAFVLDASGERLLMLHHARLDRWLQPGGHGEPGETDPLAIALREAEEECGIAGLAAHPRAPRPFDLDVHAIPAKRGEPAHDHYDVRYVLVAPRGAEPRLSAESHAVEWRPLEGACGPDADAALRRAVGKVRALVSVP